MILTYCYLKNVFHVACRSLYSVVSYLYVADQLPRLEKR